MGNRIAFLISGLVLGFALSFIYIKVANQPSHPVVTQPVNSSMNHTMNSMTSGLAGKTGDEFDRAFLKEMIVHHEGAIEMAKQASGSAKHEEIKKMATEIISAQSQEISQMRKWQKDWGY